MPIIKSAIKRARQAVTRRSRNLKVKRAIHADVRAVIDAAITGDATLTAEKLKAAQSQIDRAVKKGTLHRNTAARRKSRLVASTKHTLETAAATEKTETKTAAKSTTKATAKPKTKSTSK